MSGERWFIADSGIVDRLWFGADTWSGEITIEWVSLQNGKPPSPKLIAFDDSWGLLVLFRDVIDWMAAHNNLDVSLETFAAALREMGVTDRTGQQETSEVTQ